MLSYWESESFARADLIIVGGGIVGLSTALSWKERHPQDDVLILERGIFPTGASTRNAGFACFGSLTEVLSDIALMGGPQAAELLLQRKQGLDTLRARLGDDAIRYEGYGGYELIFEEQLDSVDRIGEVNALLHPVFGRDVFAADTSLIEHFKLSDKHVRTVVMNPLEGQIDSGAMMRALVAKCMSAGVRIATGAGVWDIREDGGNAVVSIDDPVTDSTIVFEAAQCCICTNAAISKFFPDLWIEPGRGIVMITEPIPDLAVRGAFHFQEGYYYFRNVGSRLLFGGGRNEDFDGERTHQFGLNPFIVEKLEKLLSSVILPHTPHTTSRWWSGIMGFSSGKSPIVQRLSSSLVVGFGCNGMGVALGSHIGDRAARCLEK